MTNDDLITALERQETLLVFDQFTEETAITIGSALYEKALSMRAPIVIDIKSGTRRYYFAALAGSSPDNEDWARRKGNTVLRCHMSSLLVGLLQDRKGRVQWPDNGLPYEDFITHGGGFPVTVKSVGVVAAISISGLPSMEDHALVTSTLAAHLGISDIAIAG